MLTLAISLGIYSYLVFILGVNGWLNKTNLVSLLVIYVLYFIYFYSYRVLNILSSLISKIKQYPILVFFIALQVLINLIGVFGPEIGFDALWYHLTLPKLYLLANEISFIPGGLLYYSATPQLGEMIYLPSLALGGEILAKFTHFSFGILSVFALYKLSRLFLNIKQSLLVTVLFYSCLVVGWESISAYVDLIRTFFEISALYAFVLWMKNNQFKWLFILSAMIGLSIATKIVSIQSLLIYAMLVPVFNLVSGKTLKRVGFDIGVLTGFSIFLSLPWFIYSYLATGNPIYPLFEQLGPSFIFDGIQNPQGIISYLENTLLFSADPISPVYLAFIPLVLITFKKFSRAEKFIALYALFAIITLYFLPVEGGRFLLPYLGGLSLLIILAIKYIKSRKIVNYVFLFILLTSLFASIYRLSANLKFLPYLTGLETKSEFLSKNLNFEFGDFYDTDSYFKENIEKSDRVLLYGFHNLYYVDFPYIHSTWVKKGDKFNFVAVQNTDLPLRFKDWTLVYTNPLTNVKLYTNNKVWQY